MELLRDVRGKKGVFGPHLADVWVVEYQKRGMPHAHLLLWLDQGYQFDTLDAVDGVVSAVLPPASKMHGMS